MLQLLPVDSVSSSFFGVRMLLVADFTIHTSTIANGSKSYTETCELFNLKKIPAFNEK